MLGNYPLQIGAGGSIAAAFVIAVIICLIFYGVQKRSVSKLKQALDQTTKELNDMKNSLPHYNEVNYLNENVKRLCEDFTTFRTGMEERMTKFSTTATEDLNKTRELMIKTATEEIVRSANDHIVQNSVTKEEFEKLSKRIEGLLGVDELAERMEVLSEIFESSNVRTLAWQCKLIKLLNGGLAPDAEEDQMIVNSIPTTAFKKFLENLLEYGIVEEKKINAYYMMPAFEWIYSYVENPDWLQNRLEGRIKREREYHEYIKNNLNMIEEGLLLEQDEYKLATGNIDFICRSSDGRVVGLELKYPAATTAVKRQIHGYKIDYEQKTGSNDARFIVVAPKIPENLKLLLVQDGFEYKEVNF